MGENSKIEWCDHTFNPWVGCTKVAPGCAHCYAESLAKRTGLAVWGSAGTRVKTSPANWAKPLKWNREAEQEGVRKRVFCASLADVFEDWQGPIHDHRGETFWITPEGQPIATTDESATKSELLAQGCRQMSLDDLRRDLFALIDATPWLDWLLLTKRPENIARLTPLYPWNACDSGDCPHELAVDCDTEDQRKYRDNVWLGTSISDQATVDRNVPELLKCRDLAPVLFLSAEPLLGPVNLRRFFAHSIRCSSYRGGDVGFNESAPCNCGRPAIKWVIVGGESGYGARPCNIAWIRAVIEQCKAAHVPCFTKQLGSRPCGMFGEGRGEPWSELLHETKGGDWNEWPLDVRVRQFPEVIYAS